MISEPSYFADKSGPKINYSRDTIENAVQIIPCELLNEPDIKNQTFDIGTWNGISTLFHHDGKDVPFDLIAAVFYLISRYEEYLPHQRDEHDRYKASNSILHQINALETPIVNEWLTQFSDLLTNKFPEFTYTKPSYQFIPTYDIDQIYAHYGKGYWQNQLRNIRDLLFLRFPKVFERLRAMTSAKRDPYNTYDFILEENKKVSNKGIFFFLAALEPSKYDKNHHPDSSTYKQVVQFLCDKTEIGIHPSYQSGNRSSKGLVSKEIQVLSAITNSAITKSRQHYLKLQLPTTYQRLIEAGIKEDYSLGYSECIGFRSGTCTPHLFFDLTNNQETSLKLFPLNLMEVSLVHYLQLSPDEGINRAKKLIDTVKKYNGTFVMLWHNSSLSDSNEYKGWKSAYQKIMQYASSR